MFRKTSCLPPHVLDSLSLSLAFILFVSRSFILHLLNAHPYLHTLCCVLMSSPEHLPGAALCFIHTSGELDLNFEMRHNLNVFLSQIGQFKLKRLPECRTVKTEYKKQGDVAQFTFLMWRNVFGLLVDDTEGTLPVN